MGRATAQMLMKAVGEIQPVGGAHFAERPALLSFLDAMIAAPSVEEGLRNRRLEAAPPPKAEPLRVSLPKDLRSAMMPDLPSRIKLTPGRLEIEAPTATAMLESLMTLALIMQNDLDRFEAAVDPPALAPKIQDCELRDFIGHLRRSKV